MVEAEQVKIRAEAKEMVHGVEGVDGKRDYIVGGKRRYGERKGQFVLH